MKNNNGLTPLEEMFKNFNLGTSFQKFDLDELSNELSKINLKDYVNVMPKIKGMFNNLSDEDKKTVVDSFNKVDEMFGNIFGTKTHKWTVDDFKDSTVSVSGSCACEGCKADDCKSDEKATDKADCDCKHCEDDDCPIRTEGCEDDGLEPCIADVLLDELDAQTRDEDVANRVVDYIVGVLKDKKRKAYVLHPRAKGVPAAVEVDIPNTLLSKKDVSTLIIPTLIHDKVIERVGCIDLYLPSEDDIIKAYIVLEKF